MALVDVLRAAISEIEQYERVVLNVQPGIVVVGQAVNDVVHLVAEIVENATTFSPEDTQVYVSGQPLSSGGVLLDITDNGVGISDQEMSHANWRLDNPPVVDVAVSRRMGLFVVGRLARHGVRVRLRHAQVGGLTALIWLPDTVAAPRSRPARPLRRFEPTTSVPPVAVRAHPDGLAKRRVPGPAAARRSPADGLTGPRVRPRPARTPAPGSPAPLAAPRPTGACGSGWAAAGDRTGATADPPPTEWKRHGNRPGPRPAGRPARASSRPAHSQPAHSQPAGTRPCTTRPAPTGRRRPRTPGPPGGRADCPLSAGQHRRRPPSSRSAARTSTAATVPARATPPTRRTAPRAGSARARDPKADPGKVTVPAPAAPEPAAADLRLARVRLVPPQRQDHEHGTAFIGGPGRPDRSRSRPGPRPPTKAGARPRRSRHPRRRNYAGGPAEAGAEG